MIYNSLNIEIALKMRKLFIFLKDYENCFDFKDTEIFSEYKNENHVINLLSGAESSYKLFYIFFKTEFKIVKNYLLKNLILIYIREFINRANALIFFVFKKNNNFRFCINYKKLNVFIIKNKCSLFWLTKY